MIRFVPLDGLDMNRGINPLNQVLEQPRKGRTQQHILRKVAPLWILIPVRTVQTRPFQIAARDSCCKFRHGSDPRVGNGAGVVLGMRCRCLDCK